jgi:hypothetical protein
MLVGIVYRTRLRHNPQNLVIKSYSMASPAPSDADKPHLEIRLSEV